MARIFLQRDIVISLKQLKKLGLSKESIDEIQKWRNGSFEFSAIIIDTNDDKFFSWLPYRGRKEEFKKEYPEGIIW